MKVIYSGKFHKNSTNYAQAIGLEQITELIRYEYQNNNIELINLIQFEKPDLFICSKNMDIDIIHEANKICKTCLWYMDAVPHGHWNKELFEKIKHCTFTCCDKRQAISEGKKYNSNIFWLCEGYDHRIDKPYDLEQNITISFIGNLYNNRLELCKSVNANIVQVYAEEHAKIVSRSKINLNFCTNKCVSDRVYKIMGSKGFLITDDWVGREEMGIKDNEHLVLFKNINDLKNKVKYYLNNESERNRIRENGYKIIQQYTRDAWAVNLIKIYQELYVK